MRPWSRCFEAYFHLLDGRLHRAGAHLLSEFTRFADRLIDCGFVVTVEDQRAVHSCQRYAVVLGGCLRAIVQCQVCYQIGFVMGPGDCRIQRIIPA